MDAAFDGPEEGENDNLLGRGPVSEDLRGRVPGEYDFDRNYVCPRSAFLIYPSP